MNGEDLAFDTDLLDDLLKDLDYSELPVPSFPEGQEASSQRKRGADPLDYFEEPAAKHRSILSSSSKFEDEKKCQDEYSELATYICATDLPDKYDECSAMGTANEVLEAARGTLPSSTALDNDKNGQRVYSGIFSSRTDDEESKSIPDYDVVLGHSHTPTMGTRVWRDVRRTHAKRFISDKTLSELKAELRQNLEAFIENDLPRNPLFWFSSINTEKLDPGSKERRVLKGGSGCMFGIATDKAIKQDVKNAPKKDRSRNTNAFHLEGTPEQVLSQAKSELEDWVGNDLTKRLVAEGFKENLERLVDWRDEYDKKKTETEQMGKEHLHETLIHEIHVEQLNEGFASQANQLANDMVERYERLKRKLGEAGPKQLDSKGSAGTSCKSEFDM